MASQAARWGADSFIELIGHARAGVVLTEHVRHQVSTVSILLITRPASPWNQRNFYNPQFLFRQR